MAHDRRADGALRYRRCGECARCLTGRQPAEGPDCYAAYLAISMDAVEADERRLPLTEEPSAGHA